MAGRASRTRARPCGLATRIRQTAGKVDLATINEDERWTLTVRYDGRENLDRLAEDYRDWAEQVAVDMQSGPVTKRACG